MYIYIYIYIYIYEYMYDSSARFASSRSRRPSPSCRLLSSLTHIIIIHSLSQLSAAQSLLSVSALSSGVSVESVLSAGAQGRAGRGRKEHHTPHTAPAHRSTRPHTARRRRVLPKKAKAKREKHIIYIYINFIVILFNIIIKTQNSENSKLL